MTVWKLLSKLMKRDLNTLRYFGVFSVKFNQCKQVLIKMVDIVI